MAATYSVARFEDGMHAACSCHCANTVNVYYSVGKETPQQQTFSGKDDAVKFRVVELS